MDDKEMRRQCKMKVVDNLRKTAKDMMKPGVKDMKKVSVMSNDNEGLEEGLDKAKELLANSEELVSDPSPNDPPPGDSSYEPSEQMPEELDKMEKPKHDLGSIDAKIKELEEMKKQLLAKA